MAVPAVVWGLTVAVIVGLLLFDFFFHLRQAHIPTLLEAARWSAVYVGIVVVSVSAGGWSAAPRWAPSTSPAT